MDIIARTPGGDLVDDFRLHVFEMRNLPPEMRECFTSDMRFVVDYLAEGNGFRSDRPVVHKEALIRLLRALGGDTDVEDTAQILEEELGVSFDETTARVKENFSMGDEEIRRNMQLYW